MENVELALGFLAELKALCIKHNAYIGGCGCCGSPYGQVGGVEFEDMNVNLPATFPDSRNKIS